ncbi:MAG: hypothetical protein K0V04_04760 [Deltaproteobacteria bacterium]|nr:hypothetical protein [Deltaproteobacteria bacterium]
MRPHWPAAVVIAVVATACAGRTDQRVREVWGGSSQAPGREGPQRPGGRESGGEGVVDAPVLHGWARLDEVLDGAFSEAAVGTDDEAMARLAQRWCAVEPVPRNTDEGRVLVCAPDPPLQIDGHGFSLELGGAGVIGLVSQELSEAESTRLAEQALRQTERWCTHPWTDVSPPSPPTTDAPAAQLHICPVEGSALLTVGRFVSSVESELWQLSVAVIDAS